MVVIIEGPALGILLPIKMGLETSSGREITLAFGAKPLWHFGWEGS